MTDKQRYERAMRHDYPQDFISDDEWDFIEAMASCKGDGVKNKKVITTASCMPKSGGVKNMAVRVSTRRGKQVTLLNPSEKGRKCACELRTGIHVTNEGVVKCDNNGNAIPLTDTQKAWRSGYLAARKDSADCFNANNGKKKKKRNSRKSNLPAMY